MKAINFLFLQITLASLFNNVYSQNSVEKGSFTFEQGKTGSINSRTSSKKSILTVNHLQVEKEEFQREIDRHKAQVFNQFAEYYSLDNTGNFWTTVFNGLKPAEVLKHRASESVIKIKVQQLLLTEHNLWPYTSYRDLLKDMKRVNLSRKRAVDANETIYGPNLFDEQSFFNYQFTNAIISLKKLLVQKGIINLTDNVLRKHFIKMKQTVYKKDKYTYEEYKAQVQESYIEDAYDLLIDSMTNKAVVTVNTTLYNKLILNE